MSEHCCVPVDALRIPPPTPFLTLLSSPPRGSRRLGWWDIQPPVVLDRLQESLPLPLFA